MAVVWPGLEAGLGSTPNWAGSRAHNSGLSDDDAANAAAVAAVALAEEEDEEEEEEALVLDLLLAEVVTLIATNDLLFAAPRIPLPFRVGCCCRKDNDNDKDKVRSRRT